MAPSLSYSDPFTPSKTSLMWGTLAHYHVLIPWLPTRSQLWFADTGEILPRFLLGDVGSLFIIDDFSIPTDQHFDCFTNAKVLLSMVLVSC